MKNDFKEALESYGKFQEWCKENGKNPAFTKNMLEFFELQNEKESKSEKEPKKPEYSLEEVLGEHGVPDAKQKFDNIILIRGKENRLGYAVNTAIVGNFDKEYMYNIIHRLSKLTFGKGDFKAFDQAEPLTEAGIAMYESALQLLNDIL